MSAKTNGGRSRPPWLIVPPAVLGVLFLSLPTVGLLIRAPWSGLVDIYRHADSADGVDVGSALTLSVLCSLAATALSLLLGVPLAWAMARLRTPAMRAVRALVMMPLVLPPVVGGMALLLTFGVHGVIGRHVTDLTGLSLSFSRIAVVMAQTFVAMPFLVVSVEGAFARRSQDLEDAAADLGAGRLQTFWLVNLPLVWPSLLAGTVLCWARALGEFGATVLFAGNVIGRTQTAPTAVLSAFQTSPQDAVALSLPLMAVALVVIVALRDKWLRLPLA